MLLSSPTEDILLVLVCTLLVVILTPWKRTRTEPNTNHPTNAHSGSLAESQITQFGTSEETYRQKSYTCFRISNVPLNWNEDDLVRNIAAKNYYPEPQGSGYNLHLFPACSGKTNIAILEAAAYSAPFRDITTDSTKTLNIQDGADEITLSIDRHFYGFTPLNKPRENISAEYVFPIEYAGMQMLMSRCVVSLWLPGLLGML